MMEVLCHLTELFFLICTSNHILRKCEEFLGWRDLLQRMHGVPSTTVTIKGFQCINKDFCFFLSVVVQVQDVSLNGLLPLFLFFWQNRSFLVVVKEQGKPTRFTSFGFFVRQNRIYIHGVTKLSFQHCRDKSAANRELHTIDEYAKSEQLSVVGAERDECRWCVRWRHAEWQKLAASRRLQNLPQIFRQAPICYIYDKLVVFARNCKFANLIQHIMQYMLCDSALFAHETLFLTNIPLSASKFASYFGNYNS